MTLALLRFGSAMPVQMRGVFEYLPDVRIGEAADHVLACQQGAEDLDLVTGDGIERFGGPPFEHVDHLKTFLPLRVTSLRTLNPSGRPLAHTASSRFVTTCAS